MKGLKIDYIKLNKELKGYSKDEKFYSYEIYLNKKFDSLDAFKLFLSGVGIRRELLLDFAEYSENDKTSEAIDECVDNYLDSIK